MSRLFRAEIPAGMNRRSTRSSLTNGAALTFCAAIGAIALFCTEFSGAEADLAGPIVADLTTPATETVCTEQLTGLGQVVAHLENELNRLEAASDKLESMADRLFGPAVEGTRKLKLPEDHEGLIRYLKQSVTFVDEVAHSFGDLVVGDDQVDLQQRIPEARKHLARLEKSGVASMLARRQVRLWIEKDMQAVEALCDDWDDIEPATRQLIEAANQYDDGRASLAELVKGHQALLEASRTRTHFEKTKLGILCRQTIEGAREIDRQRQSGLVQNAPAGPVP